MLESLSVFTGSSLFFQMVNASVDEAPDGLHPFYRWLHFLFRSRNDLSLLHRRKIYKVSRIAGDAHDQVPYFSGSFCAANSVSL